MINLFSVTESGNSLGQFTGKIVFIFQNYQKIVKSKHSEISELS